MESSEEDALFRSFTSLYFVQSPTTTLSFHSPTTQRRLTLSHYSSRGSTNDMLLLPDKLINVPVDCSDGGGVLVVNGGEKGGGGEVEEEKGGGVGVGKKKGVWGVVSFSRSDSCGWIGLQIGLRVMVSLGFALLFFYLVTKPPSPRISLKPMRMLCLPYLFIMVVSSLIGLIVGLKEIERMNEFVLGEGVDNTGVTTKFLTCNTSINLLVNIKSRLYGLHIHPLLSTMSFEEIPIATSMEKQALYASSNGPSSFMLYLGTRNKAMYGAGRSMQDILDSGKGLSLVVHVKLSSRFHVVGKLIHLKYHHHAECILIITSRTTHDQQHKSLTYDTVCNML